MKEKPQLQHWTHQHQHHHAWKIVEEIAREVSCGNYSTRRRRGIIVMWLCVAVMYGTVTSHHDEARDGFIMEIKLQRKINKISTELSHYRIKNRFNASTWLSGTELFAYESHVAKRFHSHEGKLERRLKFKISHRSVKDISRGENCGKFWLNSNRFFRRFQLTDCSIQDSQPMARRSQIENRKTASFIDRHDLLNWPETKQI